MGKKRILLGATELVAPWVSMMTRGQFTQSRGEAIGLLEDDKIIAGVIFEDYNGASISMHVAALPGARWLTRAFLGVCFDYPFNQLGVRKVLGIVPQENLAAQRFDEHLGFVEETRIKNAHLSGDLIIYSMTREQCRWLNLLDKEQHNVIRPAHDAAGHDAGEQLIAQPGSCRQPAGNAGGRKH